MFIQGSLKVVEDKHGVKQCKFTDFRHQCDGLAVTSKLKLVPQWVVIIKKNGILQQNIQFAVSVMPCLFKLDFIHMCYFIGVWE